MNTQEMEMITLPIAQRLSADMVIVNMPIENLNFRLLPVGRKPPAAPPPPQPPLVIGDVRVGVDCPQDRECSVSRAWNVAPGRELSRNEVNHIKRVAARWALRRRLLWDFRPFIFRQGGISHSVSAASSEEKISAAIDALLAIKQAYPVMIITINPAEWYFDPATQPALLGPFVTRAREAGLTVIDMRDRLPSATPEEHHRWFNMPYDGHFSDYGAEIYGRAMAALISERLLMIGDGSAIQKSAN
jgi:hypothetical protein